MDGDEPDEDVRRTERGLRILAEVEGYCFAGICYECNASRSAFAALIEELERAEAHHVVVPSLRHFADNHLLSVRRWIWAGLVGVADGRQRGRADDCVWADPDGGVDGLGDVLGAAPKPPSGVGSIKITYVRGSLTGHSPISRACLGMLCSKPIDKSRLGLPGIVTRPGLAWPPGGRIYQGVPG
jgi:hypothetical protein